MPLVFGYKARDARGRLVSGFVEAESEAAAVASLRERNYYVVNLHAAPEKQRETDLASIFRKKVSARDLAVFCRQFSAMINAGVPVLQSIHILAKQAENRHLRSVLSQVAEHLESGSSLSEAFRFFPREFPTVFTSMIEAGEVGGVLEDVLSRLAVHFEKEQKIRDKTVSALTYPVVVLVVAVIAVAVLLTFVLPTFVGVLQQLSVTLPWPTRVTLGISGFCREYWYLVFGVLGLFPLLFRMLLQSDAGREWWDRLLLRLPIFGKLVQKIIIARFSRTLATLVRSGVPIMQALDVVRKTAGNVVVAKVIEQTTANVGEGGEIAGLLEKSGVFPLMVAKMIAVGEETGALDSLLEKVADFYEDEVDHSVSQLSSMLEPVMVIIMGGIVGFIILSVLLPMFDVIGSYGG
ncbi:MAG: type II secretion system F family protein [Peptococcaceae bacterium]|nr:type II secretion system F family protein [Peptococcaceae bacterium]